MPNCEPLTLRVSASSRAAVCATLLLIACTDPEIHVGGEWYVRDIPADSVRRIEAHRNLVRKANGAPVIVASFIGPQVQYYPPDCAMYVWWPSAMQQFRWREVWLACGTHWPARVAFLSRQGARMDPDGLRPAPGVTMRANSWVVTPVYDETPKAFLAIADLRAAAERQPTGARDDDSPPRRANLAVVGVMLVILIGLISVRRAGMTSVSRRSA